MKYDVVILGGGPGGYVAAIRGGQLGLKVALVEKEAVGGVCLHHGCIPSKAIIRNAEVLSLFRRAEEFGISLGGTITADYSKAVDRSVKIIERLHNGIKLLHKKYGVDVTPGIGRIVDPKSVEVGGKRIEGSRLVIATGSSIQEMSGVGFDKQRVISSDDALTIRKLPESMAIIGAGAVGVEFAYVFAAYGVKVHMIELMPQLLPQEDAEIARALEKALKKQGVEIHTGCRVKEVTDEGTAFALSLEGVPPPAPIRVGSILVAIGRVPNVEGIGLEKIGVKLRGKYIQVNARQETSVPGVYAIGDVTGEVPLAHAAMAEGAWLMEEFAGLSRPPVNRGNIPNVIFSHPQVASVGQTEETLKKGDLKYKVGKFNFAANGKALGIGEPEGFIKVLSDEESGEILGVHMIGPEVTELIGEFVLARSLESTALEVAKSVHPHPTLSEGIGEAAADILKEAIHH